MPVGSGKFQPMDKRKRSKWRSGRDSNPRDDSSPTPLAGARLRPLGHRSAAVVKGKEACNQDAIFVDLPKPLEMPEFPVSSRLEWGFSSVADDFKFNIVVIVEIETTARFIIRVGVCFKTHVFYFLFHGIQIFNNNPNVVHPALDLV